MAKKHTAEQIVALLRQIEIGIGNGKTHPQSCREAGITEQTYYHWRKEYGWLKLDQARRLKELERENARHPVQVLIVPQTAVCVRTPTPQVPLSLNSTGMEGAGYGQSEAVHAGADREPAGVVSIVLLLATTEMYLILVEAAKQLLLPSSYWTAQTQRDHSK
jgi:putative transposase